MISIDEQYKLTELFANVNQTGANLTPLDFNTYINPCVLDIVKFYYGLPTQYRPGIPVAPAIAYEKTQLVVDYLAEIKVPSKKLIIPPTGRVKLPDDYIHYSSLEYDIYEQSRVDAETHQCTDDCDTECTILNTQVIKKKYRGGKQKSILTDQIRIPVTICTDGQFVYHLNDPISPPEKEYPLAKFDGGWLQFEPKDLGEAYITYLRYPKDAFWAHTNANGLPTYTPTGSVDIEMPKILMTDIAMAVLDRLGFNTRDKAMIEYAKNFKQTST